MTGIGSAEILLILFIAAIVAGTGECQDAFVRKREIDPENKKVCR